MAQTVTSKSAREASLERRRALTTMGKAALKAGATASTTQTRQTTTTASTVAGSSSLTGRAASRARRDAMSNNGKAGLTVKDRTRAVPAKVASSAPASTSTAEKAADGCGCGCNGTKSSCNKKPEDTGAVASSSTLIRANKRQVIARTAARAASLARREATSSRGKAGINAKGLSAAQTARAANPDMSSRELAMALREARSRKGKTGDKKSQPCGRRRNSKPESAAAQDAAWKVGASETTQGQTLTGTMVGRSQKVTGDEPSTCREVTGTEYMGADIFRDFCQSEPGKTPKKVTVTTTSHGNAVSGNKIGRGKNVTGDEPGTCKRVTGNEYFAAKQTETFCSAKAEPGPGKVTGTETRKGKTLTGNNVGRTGKVTGDESGADRELTGSQYVQPGDKANGPVKVGTSMTLRGGQISGTMVGRGERITGDEPGSCRNVTGDDYIGQEQYSGFCSKTPQPQDSKVGVSATLKGKTVTGTMTGRSGGVTGDEAGTCKSVTGTPYAGSDQLEGYCKPEEVGMAVARTRQQRSTPGSVMTGIQPGVAGKATGDAKGACENVSGTPYVGADQFAQACPATAADTASPDFPQAIAGTTPWTQFSVTPPSGGAQTGYMENGVTGSSYEKGHITGSFGKADGKLTGTEEARFDHKNEQMNAAPVYPVAAEMADGRIKARISGEGMDAGAKITGDDWDRGDNVTGTEGLSAKRRNPTIHSSVHASSVMQAVPKRNEDIQTQVSRVTGGSGNTEKGSLITYSGGARG
jgi:hypothetical protein